jgi:hypothetical protein
MSFYGSMEGWNEDENFVECHSNCGYFCDCELDDEFDEFDENEE